MVRMLGVVFKTAFNSTTYVGTVRPELDFIKAKKIYLSVCQLVV